VEGSWKVVRDSSLNPGERNFYVENEKGPLGAGDGDLKEVFGGS